MRSLRRIFNIGSCARLCESNPSCCSFEYSKTTLRCNLNSECEPDEQKYLDYDFCGRGNHIHIDADWSWLILIDSDLFWLMLTDSDWFWFMLIDAENILRTPNDPFRLFSGEDLVWETSVHDFSDTECQHVKGEKKGSLQKCKSFCLEERRCTAINWATSTRDCLLRECNLPVLPPLVNPFPTYDSYWLFGYGNY